MAAKQSKSKKQESFATGNVTPRQIAFIVDRYLCDNNFSTTRSAFRVEASSLISHSLTDHAPKTLLTLAQMLDEYVRLKEQKVMLDQERVLIEKEKTRVQMLLQGMHNVMSAYNASGNLPPVPAPKSAFAVVPQPKLRTTSHPAFESRVTSTTSMPNKLNTNSLPQSNNANTDAGNFTTPVMNISGRKRKETNIVEAPSASKRTCGRSSSRNIPVKGQSTLQQSDNANNNQVVAQPSSASSPEKCTPTSSQVQGSGVVKCLFNQTSISVPSNSPVPKTPPRASSSHGDTHITPSEISSVVTRNRDTTPTRCTVISTKRVMVSPSKQMAYIQMSHCISPVKTDSDKTSKRDHVRSRLDFDASDMPEILDKPLPNEISTSTPLSEKELNILDIDFPDLDTLEMDYFTEILNDFDFTGDGIDFSCYTTSGPSKDHTPGSSPECNVNDAAPELSTVSAVLCEKDMKCKAPIF